MRGGVSASRLMSRTAAVGAALMLAVAGCGSATRTVTETVAKTTATLSVATAPTVVLGSKTFVNGGEGWGTSRPSKIYNGGDPSGLVSHIHWTTWGGPIAVGKGLHSIFKPNGGYYNQLVPITLRASHVGTCSNGGPRAYLKLETREPEAPGGLLGTWDVWSEARSLCSYNPDVRASESSATTSSTVTTPSTSEGSPAPQTFSGNGVKSLGTITVATPSTLEWSCSSCHLFSVTGLAEGAAIAVDSQDHTSGTTAVEPGTYHSVDVQAFGEAGAAGEWSVTITPNR